jgi:hypothetical protein
MYDWDTEMRPVLDAVYRIVSTEEGAEEGASQQEINAELGREPSDRATSLALEALARNGYLTGPEVDEPPGPVWSHPTEKALQLVAGWPAGAADAAVSKLLALAELRIVEASTAEERGRWERVREGLLSFGRDVLVEVVGSAAGAG